MSSRDDLIFVKPGEGRTVRDPNSYLLMPPEGQFVALGDPHWLSLLRFGDIVLADPPAAALTDLAAPSSATN